jgi:hypothetical protein
MMLVNMKRSAKMLILIAVVAITLTAITTVVYASRIYNIGGGSWISCGSSAGDVQWDCPVCSLPPSPSEGGGPGYDDSGSF